MTHNLDFRFWISTSHSLIEIIEQIRNCIDNSNYGTIVYFKLANATSATAGTTAAAMVFLCPASVKRSYAFPEGITFSAGFSHWCTTESAEANTDAPTTPPTVRYITS